MLADSKSRYVWNFNLYTGKEITIAPEKGLTHNVVMNLVSGLENKGYHVYTDNFYSSSPLFRELHLKGFEATGTVRSNRKGISKTFQQKTLQKGEVNNEVMTGNITCLEWKDKRDVTMMSTRPDTGLVDIKRKTRAAEQGTEMVKKPKLIHEYNSHMGGVDISDQLVRYYGYPHGLPKKKMKFDNDVYKTFYNYFTQGGKEYFTIFWTCP